MRGVFIEINIIGQFDQADNLSYRESGSTLLVYAKIDGGLLRRMDYEGGDR